MAEYYGKDSGKLPHRWGEQSKEDDAWIWSIVGKHLGDCPPSVGRKKKEAWRELPESSFWEVSGIGRVIRTYIETAVQSK